MFNVPSSEFCMLRLIIISRNSLRRILCGTTVFHQVLMNVEYVNIAIKYSFKYTSTVIETCVLGSSAGCRVDRNIAFNRSIGHLRRRLFVGFAGNLLSSVNLKLVATKGKSLSVMSQWKKDRSF